MLLFLVACGIDTNLQGKDDAADGFDSGTDVPVDDSTDTVPVDEETCNGLDDDGDGAVDEDFEDFDVDGVADCVDDACALDVIPAGTVAVDAECVGREWVFGGDLTEYATEWSIPGPDILSNPVVANLTDDDGDGDIDIDDIPDILGVDYYTDELWRFSGDGSSATVIGTGIYPMAVAAGDVDADGVVNIVTAGTSGACATEPDGTVTWCNAGVNALYNAGPTVTDLEGDGRPEVIVPPAIMDGVTGADIATDVCNQGDTFPVVGDLDGDGIKEIICGKAAWRADGTRFWNNGGGAYDFAALVDVDADEVPEVLVTGWPVGIFLYSWDGMLLGSTGLGGTYSAACVADLDGDGAPEFGVPSQFQLEVYDADLTLKWTYPTSDSSGAASCSAFDFDADGAYELLYGDEQTYRLFDGATGTVLLEWAGHSSGTMWEYPVVADVDNDGASEVVLAESFYGNTGITVLGSPTGDWAPTDQVWGQYAFDGGNILPDGEILADPPAPYRDGGFIHARPPGFLDGSSGEWDLGRGRPDLGVAITDVCVADCTDGPLSVSVSVANRGGVDAEAVVVLEALDDTGPREVARSILGVPSGTRAEPLVYDLLPTDLGPLGLRATVSRVDGGMDCDMDDNVDDYLDVICL